MKLRTILIAPLLLAAIQASAFAETATVTQAAEPHNVSINLRPLALIAGWASVTVESPMTSTLTTTGIVSFGDDGYEGGLQLRKYFGSGMQGGHYGLQSSYATFDAEDEVVRTTASGLAAGAFAGYKWITNSGFTLEAQAGLQYLVVTRENSNDEGTTTVDESNWLPIINLGAGWSF